MRRQFDHFAISKQIGEGGMSRVFDAEDSTLGRHVALKILNRNYSKDSVRMASFEREAQLTAAVTHPHVVKLYSVGRDQGNFYIAMELVGGGSLEQRITDSEHLTEKEALRVGRGVAEGLRAAYREGLIHRDVKPANILFTEDDTPKIVDFGLALFHERDVDDSGEIWATPFYVAPEKVRDDREDFRSDMFSLGATLYHALTGKPPHKANTNSIQELKIIKSKAVKLEDSGFKFSTRTCDLVNRMLALRPEDRFKSYDAVVEAFRDAESLLGYSEIGQRSRRLKLIYGIAGTAISLALLAILIRPSGDSKSKSIILTEGVDETELVETGLTLDSGAESVADKFLRARSTLVDGKYEQARKLFDELIRSDRTKQPTLNWARFNAAICSIVAGKKDEAENYFQEIKSQADEGQEMGSRSFKSFFGKIGNRLSDDLGLKMARSEVSYQTDNEEVLGYLAHGLAQWHFGKPQAAIEWLDAFNRSTLSNGQEWIGSYKKLITPYFADMEVAKSVGSLEATPFANAADAQKALAKAKGVLPKLKTNGALRNSVNEYARFAQSEITRIKRLSEETERRRLNEVRQRELAQLNELTESLPALVRGYDYGHSVELIENMHFESPEVQNAVSTKLYVWSKAKEFVDTLMADVNERGFSGSILRKTGMPLQGRLSKMDLNNATITMERGQFIVPSETLSAEGLITMAQTFSDSVSDSTDYYRRQELIAIFAKIQGLSQTATTVAGQLMEENRPFRQRWARVEQGGY